MNRSFFYFICFFFWVFLAPAQNVFAANTPAVSYWLWGGLTEHDLPALPGDTVYIYQGVIEGSQNHARYHHKGVYPYPIQHAPIHTVFRLTSLVDAKKAVSIYLDNVDAWKRNGIDVQGLQLDYDCPTSKLKDYAEYLERFRTILPLPYKLSVTGLGDWILKGDARDLKRIAAAADDITFQLYQGRRSFENGLDYIEILKHAEFPFRVGLLAHDDKQEWLEQVKPNPYYRGVVFFLQKRSS